MEWQHKGFRIRINGACIDIERISDGWPLGSGFLETGTQEKIDFHYGEAICLIDECLEHPERFEEDEDDPRPDDWKPYEGDCEKEEYDVRLQDNRIVTRCWPNAGKFQVLLGDMAGRLIEGADVKAFRPSSPTSFEILEARREK
jgi:hypothetical protein